MRALVQRVQTASVAVAGTEVAAIGYGLLVLLGVGQGDTEADADRMVGKLLRLRIFEGPSNGMDFSVQGVGGEILCVSQFTLYANTRRGNRPSFTDAAAPELAEPLYERVRNGLGAKGGRFGAHMEVSLVNDGPVTLLIETGALP